MDISALAKVATEAPSVESLTGLSQAQSASDAGMAVIKQILDMQEDMASQMLKMMGVGGNLDIRV